MRLASVALDIQTQSLDRLYTYLVPDDCDISVGCAVLVEFGKRQALGYCMGLSEPFASLSDRQAGLFAVQHQLSLDDPGALKPILSVITAPYFSSDDAQVIQFIAHEYIAPISSCIHLFTPIGRTPKVVKSGDVWQLQTPARRRRPKQDGQDASALPEADGQIAQRALLQESLPLTQGQQDAFDLVCSCMDRPGGDVVVVDGVTGSGKTEVYLRAIRHALSQGRGAIVLVPEIALTPQTVSRFQTRFGQTVAVMHSRMSAAQRFDQWEALSSGRARVVVGARSALFAPVSDLGLIIIDEEHESTYKQESAPRYHAREVAAYMARLKGATLVLGSATPSIESLCRTTYDPTWHRVCLPARANGRSMPQVRIVDMASEFRQGTRSMFSQCLTQELLEVAEAGRKAVLLLNQRGFASFLLCRDCGFVPECPTCSVSLTYHEQGNQLMCHHCGYKVSAYPTCPSCSSPYLRKFGAGTQRVEAELAQLLSKRADVRIIRMDADTTQTKDAHQRLLEEFAQEGAAVLLGTQMIAKGLDFEDVVLVGVINADTQLKLPDFRSSERTFDLIEQVAGRAGRAELPGKVIVQTYAPDADAVRFAARYDRKSFLAAELPRRKALGYPPYGRLVNVLVWGETEEAVRNEAGALSAAIDARLADFAPEGWSSLGAAPCALVRVRKQYRWHILIKAPAHADVSAMIEPVIRRRKARRGVNVACDVDPYSLL